MPADVTVFTKETCSDSVKTLKMLDGLGIEYSVIKIEGHPEVLEFLKAEGYTRTPIVMTETESWEGHSKSRIEAINDSYDEAWGFDETF